MSKNVFAYGTLMFPEVAGPIAGLYQPGVPGVLYHYARYAIKDRGRAKLPAVVEEEGSRVSGVLYRDVDESALAALDNFEDIHRHPQYQRRSVRVALDNGEVLEAETYVAGERALALLNGPWDPEAFQREDLQSWCEAVIPRYTSGDRSR